MLNMCCEACLFGCGVCEYILEQADDPEDGSSGVVINSISYLEDWHDS